MKGKSWLKTASAGLAALIVLGCLASALAYDAEIKVDPGSESLTCDVAIDVGGDEFASAQFDVTVSDSSELTAYSVTYDPDLRNKVGGTVNTLGAGQSNGSSMTYKFGFVSGVNQFKGSIKVCTLTFKYTGNKPQTIVMNNLTVARLTGGTAGGLPEVTSESVAWSKTFSVSRSSEVPSYTGAVQTAVKPAAKPKTGTYFGDIRVKLTSATTGAAIYYTTDGTVPTRNSTLYKEEILIDESATLKAVAVLGGYNDSEVSSFEYVIKPLFADAVNHWAKEYIAAAASLGYITGFPDGTVRPNDPVTRAQFVKMAVTAFGLKAGSGSSFADCGAHWAKDFISIAADNGLITGVRRDDGNYFLPEDKITREQAAVILYRLAGTLKIGLPETSAAAEFSDKGKIQDYALPAVLAMQKAGIIRGSVKDGAASFNPGGNATRAEAVKMIQGMLELYENSGT